MTERAVATLLVSFTLLVSTMTVAETEQAAETQLMERFVVAFNAGDFETMEAFYRQHASRSFNERRTEEENRALHEQLTGMLGHLKVSSIERIETQTRLIADAAAVGGAGKAEFRFDLVGNPLAINGFSVGVNPDLGYDHHDMAGTEDEHPAPQDSDTSGTFALLAATEGVHQAQVFLQSDGSLLLIWVQRGPSTHDLFALRQSPDGSASEPIQVNASPVNRYVGDEARPSVAIGDDGAVAVAWTAANNDIMLASGSDHGTAFDAPVKLNQDKERAERTMPSVAFAPDGTVHTIWLDPRRAPTGREEPSDLYYATITDGVVMETNLTAGQETSVCGCCRPYIEFDTKGRCDMVFRNVSEDGYRDISRISGTLDALSEPQPTSPPIWKLGGCPSAGPIMSHGGTLWKDASTGDWRILWAIDAATMPEVLFVDRADREFGKPPRAVSGHDSWVLVGATPSAMIAMLDGDVWRVLRDDLPSWTTSAAVQGNELVVVGNIRGRLLADRLPL